MSVRLAASRDRMQGGRDNAVGTTGGSYACRERALARLTRFFLIDAVHLAADRGIRLPTADNTHEVAQRSAADSRIVYMDTTGCGEYRRGWSTVIRTAILAGALPRAGTVAACWPSKEVTERGERWDG
jgi:hypothetical protein